jgi:hypothetical protein
LVAIAGYKFLLVNETLTGNAKTTRADPRADDPHWLPRRADAILKEEGNPWHRYCRKHWSRARWALQLPTIPFVTGRNSPEEMAARALLCIA